MRKYPELLNPKEFVKVIYSVLNNESRLDVIYVEPKYDGANILKFGDMLYTRNLNPIPDNLMKIIRERFPEILKSRYDFYFEFGGLKNSPAGFREGWEGDYDYRVFDIYTLEPLERYVDDLRRDDLKVVEYWTFNDLRQAIDFAVKKLNELGRKVEGVIVKLYGFTGSSRYPGLRRAYQRRFIGLKIKWENRNEWKLLLDALEGKKIEEVKRDVLPDHEILNALRTAIMELTSKGRRIETISINNVWRYIEEECRKHNYELPNREKVRQMLKHVKRELK
ncbi:MAG: hypothetical protein GXO26_08135 [Crenarchaeota archaeon]|nr:hypothetical protein [Thermoproteota archaeon]